MVKVKEECKTYINHRPDETKLYKIIQENYASFISSLEICGKVVPKYIREEFDKYLECGIHAYGVILRHCENCDKDEAVAFSCKKRGFCPSCTARRMAETAVHIVDNIMPNVAVRQYVVTFPYLLRRWLSINKEMLAKVVKITW